MGRDNGFHNTIHKRKNISIHAPRVGRDHDKQVDKAQEVKFQSTRPVWGATALVHSFYLLFLISIHAPRVGRDLEA